jgi:NAD(P)-dependent dehydrogenase (short-subunit alcohol dehydrogenase family)
MSNQSEIETQELLALGLHPEALAVCVEVLRSLRKRPELLGSKHPDIEQVRHEAGALLRALKQQQKKELRHRDQEVLDGATIRHQAGITVKALPASLPPGPEVMPVAGVNLIAPRRCYICKEPYTQVHSFYDCLCPACGDVNFAKRTQTADLSGRYALVTGARVKIGFQTALKLLRAGASVIATTRFPRDAVGRFAAEKDFNTWKDRLTIYGMDLRYIPGVEEFTRHLLATLPKLDILINNAAQTVRRPAAFYQHLSAQDGPAHEKLPAELARLIAFVPPVSGGAERVPPENRLQLLPGQLQDPASIKTPAIASGQVNEEQLDFPAGEYDVDGQQVDRRQVNSWLLRIADVSTVELLEVHMVNCLAPFMLVSRLEPLLRRPPEQDRHVINVSAMEGRFHWFKRGNHPHTNMAKASLNMLTRSCADQYAQHRVFMNSVDTGWITVESPYPVAEQLKREGFRLPLDVIDGAARVCDPVFSGLNTGQNVFGKFLKDYQEITW